MNNFLWRKLIIYKNMSSPLCISAIFLVSINSLYFTDNLHYRLAAKGGFKWQIIKTEPGLFYYHLLQVLLQALRLPC